MARRPSYRYARVRTAATVIVAVIAVGTVLHLGRAAFIPVVLSALLTVLLWPVVDALERRRVPRLLAAALAVLAVIGAAGLTVQAVWSPAAAWLEKAPESLANIERKIRPAARVISKIEGVTSRATQIGTMSGGPEAVVRLEPERGDVITISRTIAVSTVTVFILSFFVLAGGAAGLAHTAEAVADRAGARRFLEIATQVRVELSRYVGTVALINIGLGLATAGVMALWGMPSPLLWGTMAAVFNFAPYIGSAATLALITGAALVVFDTVGMGLAVGASYLALTTIEGQLVQPFFLGRRLNISPTAIFIALWFGGWFWGIAGILLAVPMLVAVKAAAARTPSWSMVAALLSPARDRSGLVAERTHAGDTAPERGKDASPPVATP